MKVPEAPGRLRSWREARQTVMAAGWDLVATGDWSWVYRAPGADVVWRITPFDPAFDLFAELCMTAGQSPHLPRIDHHVSHAGGGNTSVMEFLEPVPAKVASEWLERLNASATTAHTRLLGLLSDPLIGRDTPLFAGIDSNPANVLIRPSDRALIFTDAFWIEGPKLLQLIKERPEEAVALYPVARLRDWAHLPCMDRETTDLILSQLDLTG